LAAAAAGQGDDVHSYVCFLLKIEKLGLQQ
jgi:hypothetical protein